MIASKFAGQVGDSDFERLFVDRVYDLCKPWCRKDHNPVKSGIVTTMERQKTGVLPDFEDDDIVRIAGEFTLNVDIDTGRSNPHCHCHEGNFGNERLMAMR
jgi:hypothetical protein